MGPCRRDDQLHQAARWLDIAPGRAEILELFAGKYDMDVYMLGESKDSSRSLNNVFYYLSEVIMSHQPIGLERVPLAHRFSIAMKYRGRTPADFLTTIGLEINDQLLTMTDESGSTVLHWAAMHWSIGHRSGWPSSRLMPYGQLAVDLIKAGSSVSAVNKRGHTPFMCLLAWDHLSDDWQYSTCRIPHKLYPSQIVSSWGTLLDHAGVSLPEIVERENCLLSRLEIEFPVQFWWRGRFLNLESIALKNRTTFSIEVYMTEEFAIYESQPMPGSFTDTTPNICRLPWHPSSDGDSHVFWQIIDTRTLKSSKPFQLFTDSFDDNEFDLGHILFGGTQDDHMDLVAVYRREQQRSYRARNHISGNRRSASTPPAAKKFYENRTKIPDHRSPMGCSLYVHKCPQDNHWGFCRNGYEGEPYTTAKCIAGCSGRTDHGAQIANAFLPPKKSLLTPRERWLAETFPWKYGSEANE